MRAHTISGLEIVHEAVEKLGTIKYINIRSVLFWGFSAFQMGEYIRRIYQKCFLSSEFRVFLTARDIAHKVVITEFFLL